MVPTSQIGEDMEVLIPTDEVARRTGQSARTWERRRIAGTGPEFIKIGRRVMYSESALCAWLAANTFRSTSEVDQRPA